MLKGLLFFFRFGYRTDKRYILYLVLAQLLGALPPLANVAMPKLLIDELTGMQRVPHLILYAGLLIGINVAAGWGTNWLRLESFSLRCKMSGAFDLMLHRTLLEADLENLESADFLDMQARAKKFLYADWHGYSYLLDSALNIIGQAFVLAGIIGIVATMHPLVLFLFILLVLLSTLYEMRIKKRQVVLSMKHAGYQRSWSYYASLFEDPAFGREMRVNACGEWLLSHERKYMDDALDNHIQQNRLWQRTGATDAAAGLVQQGVAYAYLLTRILRGTMGLGSFMMYTGAATSFSQAMRTVMHNVADILSYAPYYEALEQYISLPAKLRAGGEAAMPRGPHTITFDNVSFRYPGQAVDALTGVSFTLTPGTRLAIVGENGAGKTTLIKLLLRLYAPTEGRILLDGRDIATYDYDGYMQAFAAVLQDYRLFPLSLKENVCLQHAPEADDAQVASLLARVGFGDRLQTLPGGVHTAVHKTLDPEGFEPSGGEGQKIALARALYKDAPIAILDEPAAALDPRAEYAMYRNFDQLVQDKTVLYISHRLSSTRFCDAVAVLQNGRIVQWGTHEALLAQRDGLYAELFAMQAQYYR